MEWSMCSHTGHQETLLCRCVDKMSKGSCENTWQTGFQQKDSKCKGPEVDANLASMSKSRKISDSRARSEAMNIKNWIRESAHLDLVDLKKEVQGLRKTGKGSLPCQNAWTLHIYLRISMHKINTGLAHNFPIYTALILSGEHRHLS